MPASIEEITAQATAMVRAKTGDPGARVLAVEALPGHAGFGYSFMLDRTTSGGASGKLVLRVAPEGVRIAGPADVEALASMPGGYVLADTKVEGVLGGTGLPFDWSLVGKLATQRRLVLAGGLTPGNVATAIGACHPWCVDVASGVESRPGIKDMGLVKAFVEAAKGA